MYEQVAVGPMARLDVSWPGNSGELLREVRKWISRQDVPIRLMISDTAELLGWLDPEHNSDLVMGDLYLGARGLVEFVARRLGNPLVGIRVSDGSDDGPFLQLTWPNNDQNEARCRHCCALVRQAGLSAPPITGTFIWKVAGRESVVWQRGACIDLDGVPAENRLTLATKLAEATGCDKFFLEAKNELLVFQYDRAAGFGAA